MPCDLSKLILLRNGGKEIKGQDAVYNNNIASHLAITSKGLCHHLADADQLP